MCHEQAHLKVILETGELGTLDIIRRASWLALGAGADMIKTSTGKVQPSSTPSMAMVVLQAVRDFHTITGGWASPTRYPRSPVAVLL